MQRQSSSYRVFEQLFLLSWVCFVFLLWVSLRNALHHFPSPQPSASKKFAVSLVEEKPVISEIMHTDPPSVESLHRDIFEESYCLREPVVYEASSSEHSENENQCEEFYVSKASVKGISDLTETASLKSTAKAFEESNLQDAIRANQNFFGNRKNLINNPNNVFGKIPLNPSLSHEENNSESYENYGYSPREITEKDRWSTFAVDVDTASYTIARRKLEEGSIPPQASIRVEEFVNYFETGYPLNTTEWFQVHLDGAPSLFAPKYHLLRVVVQGKSLSIQERKPVNLVFLVDTSGSMDHANKIALVKKSLSILVDSLQEHDYVSLCTYAGGVKTLLQSVSGIQKEQIKEAIHALNCHGGTAMGSGILNAYQLATKHFSPEAVNRVIVCSDGDANIGQTKDVDILKTIEEYKNKGITLSTIGFGNGNYKDTLMEQLANKGNGNYYYIDSVAEAKRIFCTKLAGTLEVIAKDMKVQVEFNPETVKTYRLLGYENRTIKDKDFRNDKVDAGEIGSGHTVTALYELELTKTPDWLCHVFVRAKQPDQEVAQELKFSYHREQLPLEWKSASKNFRWIVCVAEFAENLRENPASNGTLEKIFKEIEENQLADSSEKTDFSKMIHKTLWLKGSSLLR